jgi:heme A synthase
MTLSTVLFIAAAILVAWFAMVTGERLGNRESKPLRWIGAASTGLSLVIMAAFVVGGLGFVVWAKFNAPSSDCMQCD